MSQLEKLLIRLYSKPKDFTYDELKTLFRHYGFYEENKGRTSGSRVCFINSNGIKHELHAPHPKRILKPYQISGVIKFLENWRNNNE